MNELIPIFEAERYHAHPALGSTDLKNILNCVAHKDRKIKNQKALDLGTAFHEMTMFPSTFSEKFSIAPECDRRTKQGKLDYAGWLESNASKITLKSDEFTLVNNMVNSFLSNESSSNIVKDSRKEHSLIWTDPETDILCKARPDLIFKIDGICCLGDLKTTANDASPMSFRRTIQKFLYHLQAAHYIEGAKLILGSEYSNFCFFVVEKEPVKDDFHLSAMYRLDDASLEVGGILRRAALNKRKDYIEGIEPKGYPQKFVDIGLPAYGFDIESQIS